MNVGEVQEYKLEIGENKLTFRMDFKALMKFSRRYEGYSEPVVVNGVPQTDENEQPIMNEINAIGIFNRFINTTGDYDGLVKILSCACVEKDLTEEELHKGLSFDFPTMLILDQIANNMIRGSIKIDASTSSENKAAKN